jgi:hypothetical protein
MIFSVNFFTKTLFMGSIDKKNQGSGGRSSRDNQERLKQNPFEKSEEVKRRSSMTEERDLLNEDPDEERREIEKEREDGLSEAE